MYHKPNFWYNLRPILTRVNTRCRRISINTRYFEHRSAKEIQLKNTVRLAGRKFLPGSHEKGFPEFLSSPTERFPLVLKARDDIAPRSTTFWSGCFRDQLNDLYDDFARGESEPVAVLLRGIPINDTKDFSKFVKGLGFEFFDYQGGGGIRDMVDDFVLTGAGEPKEYSVELHNDMSYSTRYPSKFIITCLKKSQFGGETAICNARQLTRDLGYDFVRKFDAKGVRYLRYCHDESESNFNSWQRSLLTDNRSEAEEFLAKNGYTFKWDGKNLIYWNDAPVMIEHPISGERVWFNQVHMSHCTYFTAMPIYQDIQLPDHEYPSHTIFPDGSDIDLRDVHHIRSTLWKTAVGVALEEGDILFVDNLSVLHSRLSYEGDRLVRTSILK